MEQRVAPGGLLRLNLHLNVRHSPITAALNRVNVVVSGNVVQVGLFSGAITGTATSTLTVSNGA